MTRIRNIVAVLAFAAGLSACGGGDGDSTPTPPVVVTPATKLEDMFGTGFGTRYRTDATAEATDPVAGDLNALSLTTDPVTI